MPYRLFTDANKLRKPPTGLVRSEIPVGVRNRLKHLLNIAAESDYQKQAIWATVVERLDLDPDISYGRGYESVDATRLLKFVDNCSWNQFLDICTVVFDQFQDGFDNPELANAFRDNINEAFIRHYSAYLLRENGTVHEPGSAPSSAAVGQARAILINTRFNGPDRQFQKAINALETRPTPDCEEAVTESVNAVEALARILIDNKKKTLGPAVDAIAREKGLDGGLVASIKSIGGYASNTGGRHGLVGDPAVDLPIAEYVVHQAAAIVFFARQYGYTVVESQDVD